MEKQLTFLKQIKVTASLLLLTIFLFVSFFQVFHHHQNAQEQSHQYAYQKVAKSCDVCYFITNQNTFATLNDYIFDFVKSITIVIAVFALCTFRIYSSCLLGFTNKGPPISFI